MLNFKGGIKLISHKYTKNSESVSLPSPAYVKIFTYGDEVCVAVGDVVKIGDKLTDCHMAHASVSGTVKEIGESYVLIENDGQNTVSERIRPFHKRLSDADFDDIISFAKKKGICYNNIPLSDKLKNSKDKATTLIISCGETAPFLCASYRTLSENKKEILYGAKIIMKALGIRKTAITLEAYKKKDIAEFSQLIGESNNFEIVTHSRKYPADHPEVIKRTFIKKFIRHADKNCTESILVITGNEAAALFESFKTGMPMINTVIPIDGDAVLSPANVSVPIGAPVSDVLAFCNVQHDRVNILIKGNPLSSEEILLDDHIQKDTDAVIALSSKFTSYHSGECIACGKCHLVCPMGLYPHRLLESDKHSNTCIRCGCCAYICPARLDFSSIFMMEDDNDE